MYSLHILKTPKTSNERYYMREEIKLAQFPSSNFSSDSIFVHLRDGERFLSIHSFNRPQQQQQQQQRRVLRLARKPINRASNFDLRSHGRHPLVRHPGGVTLPTGTTLRGISYVTWPWSPAASALEMLSSSSFAAASSLNAARTRKDKGTAEEPCSST